MAPGQSILIVEDDAETLEFLRSGLTEAGYDVRSAVDGKEALKIATTTPFDAVVLDRMLPGLDGLSVLRALRERGTPTPVIILSAIGSTDERVRGLKAGSDDYLVKPFAMTELLARIEVLLRRNASSTTALTRLVCGDLVLDLLSSRAERAGTELLLQPRALQLLEYLMRNQGQVVTRSMIFREVWSYDFDPGTNVIDVYISGLRKEIDRPGQARLLTTVRGKGYRLSLPSH